MNTRTRVRIGLIALVLASTVALAASTMYAADHEGDGAPSRPAPSVARPSGEEVWYSAVIRITPMPRRDDRPVLVSIVVNGTTLPPAPPGGAAPHVRGFTEDIHGDSSTAIVVSLRQPERFTEPYGIRCELYRERPGKPEELVQVAETATANVTIKCATENAR